METHGVSPRSGPGRLASPRPQLLAESGADARLIAKIGAYRSELPHAVACRLADR